MSELEKLFLTPHLCDAYGSMQSWHLNFKSLPENSFNDHLMMVAKYEKKT